MDDENSFTLRIGSYNISCADYGSLSTIAGIGSEIKELKLDVVGLQENDVGVLRSNQLNIPGEISQSSGLLHYKFLYSIPYQGGYYGNANISAYPIISTERTFLTSGNSEQRTLLHSIINVNGTKINFFNTHLANGNNQTARELRHVQFQEIQSITEKHRPFILTGDFNTYDFNELNELKNVILASNFDNRLSTMATSSGELYLDNIIVSDDLKIKNANVSQSPYSDHNMIYCEVVFGVKK